MRITREQLKESLREVKEYDFSKFDFTITYEEKSIVVCRIHKEQFRSVRDLKEKRYCVKCSKLNQKTTADTTESYINKTNKKYPNNNLDWSNFKYIGKQHTKQEFKCKVHGSFISTPNIILNRANDPCVECSVEIYKKGKTIKDKESFIKKAKKKYGSIFDYSTIGYTLLGDTVYNIFCNKHKIYFNTKGSNFIYNYKLSCPECTKEKVGTYRLKPQEYFINKVKEVHQDKYDLSKVIYTGTRGRIEVKCNSCKNIFFPSASNFYSGSGCPYCAELGKENRWRDELTKFYIISFEYESQTLYKIGITTKELEKRYKPDLRGTNIKYTLIYQKDYSTGRLAFSLEQKLRGRLNQYNYKGESPFTSTGTSEIFTINPTPYIQEIESKIKGGNI